MPGKHKSKMIRGVEHRGKMPRQRGRLLKFIDDRSLWSIIIMLFGAILLEMLLFAFLYKVISASSFSESCNYSLFSVLGERTAPTVQNSKVINWIIPWQSVLTNCIISFFIAIVLYKLINIKPELLKMEDHLVFDPTSGTLRLRVTNSSKFELTNIHIDATFRIHIPNSGRHAHARLQLKTDTMNILYPYTLWNIATKPFSPEDGDKPQLDIGRYDSDRIYKFIPDLLSEKYRSDDEKRAKKWDYNSLNVTITIKSPLFGTDWVYHRSFKVEDFVCGKLISVDPHEEGKEITDWPRWGQYEDMSESYCENCAFAGHCGIIKKSQRYSTIN